MEAIGVRSMVVKVRAVAVDDVDAAIGFMGAAFPTEKPTEG